MTTTIDTTNPHEEVTDTPASVFDIARQRAAIELALIDAIEQESNLIDVEYDDMNWYRVGLWTYYEPAHVQGLTDDVRRTWALEWLRTHTRLIQRVARRMGHDGPVTKFADDAHFGVQVAVDADHRLTAQVPSALTCEMVDTGRFEVIPPSPARTVPVIERRCPESIFAGIEQEVA